MRFNNNNERKEWKNKCNEDDHLNLIDQLSIIIIRLSTRAL